MKWPTYHAKPIYKVSIICQPYDARYRVYSWNHVSSFRGLKPPTQHSLRFASDMGVPWCAHHPAYPKLAILQRKMRRGLSENGVSHLRNLYLISNLKKIKINKPTFQVFTQVPHLKPAFHQHCCRPRKTAAALSRWLREEQVISFWSLLVAALKGVSL